MQATQYKFNKRVKMGGKSSKGVKCDICAITLNSEAQAQQHYSGKNHLKKLRAAQGGGEPREKGKHKRRRHNSDNKDDSGKEGSPDSKSEEGSDESPRPDTEEDLGEEQCGETGEDGEPAPKRRRPSPSPEENEDHSSTEGESPCREDTICNGEDVNSDDVTNSPVTDQTGSESEREVTLESPSVLELTPTSDDHTSTMSSNSEHSLSPISNTDAKNSPSTSGNDTSVMPYNVAPTPYSAAHTTADKSVTKSTYCLSSLGRRMKPISVQSNGVSSAWSGSRPKCLLPTPSSSYQYSGYVSPPTVATAGSANPMLGNYQQYTALSVSPYLPMSQMSYTQQPPSAVSQMNNVPGMLAPMYNTTALPSATYPSMITQPSPLSADSQLTDPLAVFTGTQVGAASMLDTQPLCGLTSGYPCLTAPGSLHGASAAHLQGMTIPGSASAMHSVSTMPGAATMHSLAAMPAAGAVQGTQSVLQGMAAMGHVPPQSYEGQSLLTTMPHSSSTSAAIASHQTSLTDPNSALDTLTASSVGSDPVSRAVYDNFMGNLPTRRKRDIHCKTCNLVFESETIAKLHFQGMKHQRRQKENAAGLADR